MDSRLGSVESARADELARLQQRAYGPDADIAGDSAAQARLSELEADERRRSTPVVDAAPEDTPVEEPTDGAEPDQPVPAATDGPQPTEGRKEDGPATTARGPIRGGVRRVLPWTVAAVSVLAATVAIGAFVLSQSNTLRPVATLTAQGGSAPGAIPIQEEIAREWDLMDADFVSYGSYGAADIWSTTTPEPKRCIAVVVLGSTWRFECTATTIDTIADIDINPGLVPPAPSGEPASNIRFVLHDGVVDVYLAPHPEGGFYS